MQCRVVIADRQSEAQQKLNAPIIVSEVIEALAKQKTKKATGPDNLTTDILKLVGTKAKEAQQIELQPKITYIELLTKLFNRVLDFNEVPA